MVDLLPLDRSDLDEDGARLDVEGGEGTPLSFREEWRGVSGKAGGFTAGGFTRG
jgi:hypothetical protein